MIPDTADVSSRVTVEVFNSVAVLFRECNNTVDNSWHRHVPPARPVANDEYRIGQVKNNDAPHPRACLPIKKNGSQEKPQCSKRPPYGNA